MSNENQPPPGASAQPQPTRRSIAENAEPGEILQTPNAIPANAENPIKAKDAPSKPSEEI